MKLKRLSALITLLSVLGSAATPAANAPGKASGHDTILMQSKLRGKHEAATKAEEQAKAAQEATAKADEEAKAKADEQAKAAKAESKVKSDAEAATKAEEETKAAQELMAKAGEEAKAKADEEAKAAEEEAKAKADAEAKSAEETPAKADEDENAKAEAEAKTLEDEVNSKTKEESSAVSAPPAKDNASGEKSKQATLWGSEKMMVFWLKCCSLMDKVQESYNQMQEMLDHLPHESFHQMKKDIGPGGKYRKPFHVGLIAAILAAGFVLILCAVKFDKEASAESCSGCFAYLAFVMQFVPLLTIFGYMGGASCEHGLLWQVHVFYAALLALAAPRLMQLGQIINKKYRVSVPRKFYLYTMAVVGHFDQYADSMATAVAYACGFSQANTMLGVLVFAIIIQVAAAGMLGGSGAAMDALTGVCADSMEDAAKLKAQAAADSQSGYSGPCSSILKAAAAAAAEAEAGGDTAYLKYGGDKFEENLKLAQGSVEDMKAEEERLKLDAKRIRGVQAILGITKMLSENMPQAALQFMFVKEMNKASPQIYLSICASLMLAANSARKGVAYFCEQSDSGHMPAAE